MDRHVIANMGAELGATTSVFPSDDEIRRFLKHQKREQDWIELKADADAIYDLQDEIDLSKLEPLIAMPSNPDNVVRVREVAGAEVYQTYIGSSAIPVTVISRSSLKWCAEGQRNPRVSLDVNPSSRQILENLIRDGYIGPLIHAGARLHQAGCNGCIGMGQAPATDTISPYFFLSEGTLSMIVSDESLGKLTQGIPVFVTGQGTGITIAFEPTDVLLALVTALRTGNLDSFFLEHGRIALYFPFTSIVPEDAGCSAVAGMSGHGMMLCLSGFLLLVLSCLAFRFVLEIFLLFFLLCVADRAV